MSIIRQDYGSLGDSVDWITDIYGNIQEKTLSTGDVEVQFDIPDTTDSHCYMLCVSTSNADTPNTQPPKTTAVVPTYGTSSMSGYKSVTYPITTVTFAQNNSVCRLLKIK